MFLTNLEFGMALHSKKNTEDLIARIEKKSQELIEVIKGKEREPDPLAPPGAPNDIYINDRALRLPVGEFGVLLKEVATLAKIR